MAYIPGNAGQFNTSPQTLTNGQTAIEQLDSLGNLKVTEQSPTMFDLFQQMVGELRALRKIFSVSAEETGYARASDFDPANFIDAAEDVVSPSS